MILFYKHTSDFTFNLEIDSCLGVLSCDIAPHTMNETLKWLSSLPILMQESFR